MRKLSHLPKMIRQLADGYSIWPLRNNLLSNEIRRIKHNPLEARMVPEAGFIENIREFIVGNYRIIFELKDSKAYLLTIHHNARNLNKKSIFEQLK